jgi:RNA polymerase sigma-70 factor (ECF subfamily)
MGAPSNPQITQLLRAWGTGDQDALRQLTQLVHLELHRLARGYMAREPAGHTLQATALINEAYLRLVNIREVNWQNRAHFFAICARLMRRILTDHARSRKYLKRGGASPHISFDESVVVSPEPDVDFVTLDDALEGLAKVDPRKCEVVELRFFGGLTVAETAVAVHVSEETVMRDWSFAKAWLLREMQQGESSGA